MQYADFAYATYVLPTLSFIAQLRAPSPEVLGAESQALRGMLPGPYQWCIEEDLFYLAEVYGQSRSFPSVMHVCRAAQKRVMLYENMEHGGLHIKEKQTELEQ